MFKTYSNRKQSIHQIAVLVLLIVVSLSWANGPGIDITVLEPVESGKVILQRLAPDTVGGEDRWRVSVEMRIKNNTDIPLELEEIRINNVVVRFCEHGHHQRW
jgi:hypothetical protein